MLRRFFLGALAAIALTGCGPKPEPMSSGGPPELRRLTEEQYRQIVADVFGSDVKISGRFEPDLRLNGLIAVGSSAVTITPTGIEQYDGIARAVAAQVVDENHRDRLVPCTPAAANGADAACAEQFLARYGRLLLRHPVPAADLAAMVASAGQRAAQAADFYAGLEVPLTGLMVTPEFLFRVEAVEPDPAVPGGRKLDGWSKAQRLSFLLWNTTPDDALLDATARGDLDRKDGLAAQVDRMLADPRLAQGVRAYFADMLEFERFAILEKNKVLYPRFSRTVVDHLVTRNHDYRDLFTTRHTFMTRALGRVYRVPVSAREGWEPYEFPADDFRAGLLTQLSFTALHAHPARSSPTLRGKALRELLLCQKVPEPPANVNFQIVEQSDSQTMRTMRERLTAHRNNETCAGCHKVIDPIGLALESFDGLGQFRGSENGAAIDTSGELDGVQFKDAVGLGRAMHDNPATSACLVGSVYRYAVGRNPEAGEKPWLDWLEQRFAADGHRLPALLRTLATSDGFYRVAAANAVAQTEEDQR